VPFYAGLTLEEIGGRGVRWQQREASGAYPRATPEARGGASGELSPVPDNATDLAGYRSIWAAPEVEFSPVLEFLFNATLPLSYVGGERT